MRITEVNEGSIRELFNRRNGALSRVGIRLIPYHKSGPRHYEQAPFLADPFEHGGGADVCSWRVTLVEPTDAEAGLG